MILACLLFGAGPASADPAPAPTPVTLTINTELPEIWFSVNVLGAAAPAPTKLADAAGEHPADVAVTVGGCPAKDHAERREVGLTGSTWCVHVSNLPSGYAVSGTLANASTSLTLTAKRKDGPGFPVFWSILALVVAAIVSMLSSTYVPALTSRMRLSLFKRDRGIKGLSAWVTTAATDGVLAPDDIVARARWARQYGVKQVTAARGRLQAELAARNHSALRDSPLWSACEEEANQPGINRQDMLTDEGARSIRAAELLKALTQADTAIDDFTASANEIIAALTDSGDREQATAARDYALSTARSLSEEGVPQFVKSLSDDILSMQNELWSQDKYQVQQLQTRAAVGRLVAAATSVSAVPVSTAEMTTSIKAAFEPVAVYIPSALLALIIMAGAVATVFSTQYLANPNFGTADDYWALALSAYGSAQATAIAAALLLIRSPKPWYG